MYMGRLLIVLALFACQLSWADDFLEGVAALQERDCKTAVTKITRAAYARNSFAEFKIGSMYMNGECVSQSYSEAAGWIALAADSGMPEAQSTLGYMVQNGLGVSQDYARAFRLYRSAAKMGDLHAQSNLGWMYSEGLGTVQDYLLAHMWYNVAAVNGDADSRKGRQAISRKMTAQQIAEAQHMARECLNSNFKKCD
jgi:TPR repeat protein